MAVARKSHRCPAISAAARAQDSMEIDAKSVVLPRPTPSSVSSFEEQPWMGRNILINTMRPRKRDLIFFFDFYLVFQNNYFILLFLATVPYQHHHHHPHRIISVSYSIRLELDRARSLYSMVIYLTYSHLNAISVFSFHSFVRKFAIKIIIMLLC